MSAYEYVTIYFPTAILCKRLRALAKKRETSFSALVVEMLEKTTAELEGTYARLHHHE